MSRNISIVRNLIWFHLYSSANKPFKGTSVSSVLRSSLANVNEFKYAVKAEYPNKLSSVHASQLRVYKNKDSFDKRDADVGKVNQAMILSQEGPLEEDSLVDGLGETEDDAVIVAVGCTEETSKVVSMDVDEIVGDLRPVDDASNNQRMDIHTHNFKRLELVDSVSHLLERQQLFRLTAPFGYGKTSLIKLYMQSIQEEEDIKAFYISLKHQEKSCEELFLECGIDLEHGKVSQQIKEKLLVVVFVDDAEERAHDGNFIVMLIKVYSRILARNVRVVISSTCHVGRGDVDTSHLSGIDRARFLLPEDSSKEFLESSDIGLPKNMQYDTFKRLMIKDCGRVIGALRESIDSLKRHFANEDRPSEDALIQYYLSNDFMQGMSHFFKIENLNQTDDKFKTRLKDFMFLDYQYPLYNEHEKSILLATRAGLIAANMNHYGFSSELAKRYSVNWLYPNRSLEDPSSLFELLKNVISSMPVTIFNSSNDPGDQSKELILQFMEGLASFTPADCHIIPEVSKILPLARNPSTLSMNEFDFYLNGKFRWGIKVITNENANHVLDHISRFILPDGEYSLLGLHDYAVVDIRRNPTGDRSNIFRHPKLISVLKNTDHSIEFMFGQDADAIKIQTAD